MNDRDKYIKKLAEITNEISILRKQLTIFNAKSVTIDFNIRGDRGLKGYNLDIEVDDYLSYQEKQAYIDMILSDIGRGIYERVGELERDRENIIKGLNRYNQ